MTRRLVISYVLVAAFVLLIVELPLGITYAGRSQDRLLAEVERDARVLAGLVEERVETGDTAAVSTITERYAGQTEGRVVVTDATGMSLVDTSRPGEPARDFSTRPEMIAALDGSQDAGIRSSDTLAEELAYVAVPISSDGVVTGVVRISYPTDALREQVRENWLRLGVLSVLVLAAAASVGWLISRWAVAPVGSLEEGAARLAAGDLGGRAEVDRGPPELRHLAETFNDMAARLEVLVDAQRAFVADASHQLRTPLTALRLRIESLEDTINEPMAGHTPAEIADCQARTRRDVEAIGSETERLTRLVEGLLAIARSEAAVAMTPIDATGVATQAVQRWSALAGEHGVELQLSAPESAQARAVAGGLEQMLDNLLDNAIGVAPDGSSIAVTVDARSDGVHIGVRDHGPGMVPEDRARATDRFWRAADAEPGGSGLGLAIVAELASVSGGSVTLDAPEDGDGLVVDICLPHSR